MKNKEIKKEEEESFDSNPFNRYLSVKDHSPWALNMKEKSHLKVLIIAYENYKKSVNNKRIKV